MGGSVGGLKGEALCWGWSFWRGQHVGCEERRLGDVFQEESV